MQSTHQHQMQAIVLAGVHLWEESAFDNATPRPLLPVGQQPLICHGLQWLQRSGIKRATICANSTSRFIRQCLGPGTALGMDLDYYEDWTPRGPAGCARDAALGAEARRYVVIDGTIIPQVDLARLLAWHEQSGAAVTIAVSSEAGEENRGQGTGDRGQPATAGARGEGRGQQGTAGNGDGGEQGAGDGQQEPQRQVAGVSPQLQRPSSGTESMAVRQQLLSPVGVYVFEPGALEKAGAVGYQDIKEVLIPRLHADGEKIALYGASGPCPRVSGLGSYLAVNEWVLEHFGEQPEAASAYRRVGEAWVHNSAQVDAAAQLIGKVLVGPDSQVGKGAMVIGPCVIGAECVVASEAIVSRSVIWNLCRVGRGASVDRCVLAHYCSVPSRARMYDRVQLPAPEPGRLLQRLQAWTGVRAIPRSLPIRRVPARTYDPASVEAATQGKPAGASKKRSVGVSAV